MASKVATKTNNVSNSRVCFHGQVLRNIILIAQEAFPTEFRMASVNREEERFDILLVDADEQKVKAFELKHEVKIENTISKK